MRKVAIRTRSKWSRSRYPFDHFATVNREVQ